MAKTVPLAWVSDRTSLSANRKSRRRVRHLRHPSYPTTSPDSRAIHDVANSYDVANPIGNRDVTNTTPTGAGLPGTGCR